MTRARSDLRIGLGAVVVAALVAIAVGAAHAYVPPAKRVAAAAAKANRAAERDRSLVFQVALRRGDSEVDEAVGTLISSPNGSSRLELRDADGVLRVLRRGSSMRASRNGEPVDLDLPLLPPVHVLQAASGGNMLTALGRLGASAGRIELGHDDAVDAFVLGGRDGAGLWVDTTTLFPVRVDLAGGAVVRFGEPIPFDGILWPGRMTIDRRDADAPEPVHLEFRGATATTPKPETFQQDWLLR